MNPQENSNESMDDLSDESGGIPDNLNNECSLEDKNRELEEGLSKLRSSYDTALKNINELRHQLQSSKNELRLATRRHSHVSSVL